MTAEGESADAIPGPSYGDRPAGVFLTEAARTNPIILQGIEHPTLRQLHAYWDKKRAGRQMPKRADVDPAEIKSLLPHILIVSDLGDRRFLYRLVGSAVVAASGAEITRACVGERTTGRYRDFLLTLYETAFQASRPVFSRNNYAEMDSPRKAVIRLLLPLSDNGVHAEQIIAAYVFDYEKLRHGSMTSDNVKNAQASEELIEVL